MDRLFLKMFVSVLSFHNSVKKELVPDAAYYVNRLDQAKRLGCAVAVTETGDSDQVRVFFYFTWNWLILHQHNSKKQQTTKQQRIDKNEKYILRISCFVIPHARMSSLIFFKKIFAWWVWIIHEFYAC